MPCSNYPYGLFSTESEMQNSQAVPYYRPQATTPGMTPAMTLPTGIPSGPPYGTVPVAPSAPQPPQTLQSPYYLAGQLRKYIGRDVRVEFLIGSSGPLIDRIGTLLEVGASYITLKPIGTDDLLVCDFFSIKFVTVYR